MLNDHMPATRRPAPATLVARAVAAGTPRSVAAEAMRTTRSRLPGRGAADAPVTARAEAYFWGVIRRRALQGAAPAVSRRLVIASLELELREAGHTPEAIRRELIRLYGVESSSPIGPVGEPARALA